MKQVSLYSTSLLALLNSFLFTKYPLFFFQIVSPSRLEPIPPDLAMTSSFVWNLILLLCPFHKELIIWQKIPSVLVKHYLLFSFFVYCCRYRQLARKKTPQILLTLCTFIALLILREVGLHIFGEWFLFCVNYYVSFQITPWKVKNGH